jgi:hypothetical protein
MTLPRRIILLLAIAAAGASGAGAQAGERYDSLPHARTLTAADSLHGDSLSRQRSLRRAALEPSVLRSEAAAPQFRPRPGTNLPVRIACIAVFVVGLIWIAKLALD